MKNRPVLCVDTQLYNLRNNRVSLPFYVFGIYSAAKESSIKDGQTVTGLITIRIAVCII